MFLTETMQNLHRTILLAAAASAVFFNVAAHADNGAKPQAAAPAAAPAAPIDPEKQKLIDRLLQLYHPEQDVLRRVQAPADAAIEQSRVALQQARLPQDKIEKDLRDLVPEVQKYIDSTKPVVEASIKKNLVPSVAPILAQQFTADELRQLIAMYESPVTSKFAKMQPQLELAVGQKVHAEIGPEVNKNIDTLNKSVGLKLRADLTVN
jgi:hypothetical protein